MAAMELRVVPAGVDEHVHRGVQNFVRLRRGSIIHAAVNNYTWTADPDDGTTPCVPYHIVEGLYARLIEAAADVAAADIQFGHSRLGIEILLAAEASLSSEFDSSSCGIDEFVRRVEVEAARPGRTAVVAFARHFFPLEPFLMADSIDDVWASDVEAATLVDSSGRLAPFADLALLVGPRNARATRLLSSNSAYSASLVRLAGAVGRLDTGIVLPAPIAAVPGGRGRGAGAGGAAGRGRGACAALPVPPIAPLPSSEFDDDIRLGLADWLRSFALPVELFRLPRTNRDVRLEIQAREDFADDKRRENVVRSRFPTMLGALPALTVMVEGVSLAAQLELVQRLALALMPGTFDVRQVASFRALDDSAGDYIHVLKTGGGAASLPPSERVRKVLEEHVSAEQRRRGAPVSHGADASGGGGSSSGVGALSGGLGSTKAPAFLRVNSAALERFVASHSARLIEALGTPESAAFVDAGSAGPLPDRDPKRILRVVFRREWGVGYLQFMQTTRPCGHEMFDCIFPFKHHLYSYVSACVFQNADGTLDDDLRKDLIEPTLVDKILSGRDWPDIDLFTPLEGRLRKERGRVPRPGENTAWPAGVFRDQALLLKVQHYGDALFSAFGFKRRSSTGFHGCMQHIIEYIDKHDDESDDPSDELFDIYQEFMRSAMGCFRAALESNAEAAFPIFAEEKQSWHARIAELRKSAQRRTADKKRRGSVETADTAPSPSPSRQVQFGRFANVNIDGGTVRSRDSNASSAHSDSAPDGASGKSKRMNAGPPVMGSESHRVDINAARMKINFPDRHNAGGTTLEWKTPAVRKWLKRNEGTDDKCPVAAVSRTGYFRTVLCPYANTPGHMHPGDTAHTFSSSPWDTLNGPTFVTRL